MTLFCTFRYGLMFRVRGYGLHISLFSPILFSERNGYRKKLLRIGTFAIEVLKP